MTVAAAPSSLGPYRLLRPIGRGGMGIVYEALAPSGKHVALKTVKVPHARLLATIRREIHALTRLSHPGIVAIVDHGVAEGGVPWYAMELCQGVALRRFAGSTPAETLFASAPDDATVPELHEPAPPLDAPGGLHHAPQESPGELPVLDRDALARILTVTRKLCGTLGYLHGEGIVHGDLKPDNVLVRPDGEPLLVDFGLATRFAVEQSREALSMSATGGGTVWYVPPEQARGDPLDARADLYALGCILYELLTGRPPFLGRTTRDVLAGHQGHPVEPPSRRAHGIPKALDDVVLGLLAKEPRARIGHADSVAAMLALLGAGGEPGAAAARSYLYRPGLAGREGVVGEMAALLRAAREGEGRVALLAGESGVGKTRLALAVAAEARRKGMAVVHCECVTPAIAPASGEAAAPLAHGLRPLLVALADRCREKGLAETEHVLGAAGPILAAQEPELRLLPGQRERPEPPELPADDARQRYLRALFEACSRFADARPLLVVVDDLQWADDLTLRALELAAVRDVELRSTVLLGTYRTDEAGDRLRALADRTEVHLAHLGRLDRSAVASMVADMLALAPAPAALVEYLVATSSGNPFFVAEYLRASVADGALVRDPKGSWQVRDAGRELHVQAARFDAATPPPLLDLVARRLAGLGLAGELAAAAAVLGKEHDAERLERLAGMEEGPYLDALALLLRRDVLEESAPGRLRFVHDKLREVAYAAIPRDALASLHDRAAGIIDALPAPERREELGALALHRERAGDLPRARDAHLEAARAELQRHGLEEAERHFVQHLALVEAPGRESLGVEIELAETLYVQGKIERARQLLEQAIGRARLLREPALEAAARRRLAGSLRPMGRFEEARVEALGALALHERLGDRAQTVHDRIALGEIQRSLGSFEEAAVTFETAHRDAEELGDTRAAALALRGVVVIDALRGRYEEARRKGAAAIEILKALGDKRGTANLLVAIANTHGYQRKLPRATALLMEALALQRECGDRIAEGVTLHNLGVYRYHMDDVAGAIEILEEALALRRRTGARAGEGLSLMALGLAELHLGKAASTRARLESALVIFQDAGDREGEANALGALASLERRTGGRAARARELARRAMRCLLGIGLDRDAAAWICERGHVALWRGRDARAFLASAERLAREGTKGHGTSTQTALERLRRAIDARDRGEALFQGEHPDDVPDALLAEQHGAP